MERRKAVYTRSKRKMDTDTMTDDPGTVENPGMEALPNEQNVLDCGRTTVLYDRYVCASLALHLTLR